MANIKQNAEFNCSVQLYGETYQVAFNYGEPSYESCAVEDIEVVTIIDENGAHVAINDLDLPDVLQQCQNHAEEYFNDLH